MISAGSAVSESRTAPRTDCSASRFCGGAVAVSPLRWSAIAIRRSSLGRPRGLPAPPRARSPRLSAELLRSASVACRSASRRDRAAGVLLDDVLLALASTTIVLMVAVTSSATSTTTMRVPTVRIGSSRWTLRRSMRMPRASRMASTMSCDVTEPNRRPSSPAWCGDGEDGLVEQLGVVARLRGRLRERLLGGLLAALGGGDRALGGGLGQLARDQVVAQVALRDVDDRAALAQRLVVLEQDRLGHGGSSARGRGRDPVAAGRARRATRACRPRTGAARARGRA